MGMVDVLRPDTSHFLAPSARVDPGSWEVTGWVMGANIATPPLAVSSDRGLNPQGRSPFVTGEDDRKLWLDVEALAV